jgi:hypothetical protein
MATAFISVGISSLPIPGLRWRRGFFREAGFAVPNDVTFFYHQTADTVCQLSSADISFQMIYLQRCLFLIEPCANSLKDPLLQDWKVNQVFASC